MRRSASCLTCCLLMLAMLGNLGMNSATAKEPKKHSTSRWDKDAKKKEADAAAKKKDDSKKQSAKEAAKPEAASKPDTAKVKKGLFRIEVDLEGVFEART